MLVGLLPASSGEVKVFGETPDDTASFLSQVGFVAQDAPLYRDFSAADHLRMGKHLNPTWHADAARDRLDRGRGPARSPGVDALRWATCATGARARNGKRPHGLHAHAGNLHGRGLAQDDPGHGYNHRRFRCRSHTGPQPATASHRPRHEEDRRSRRSDAMAIGPRSWRLDPRSHPYRRPNVWAADERTSGEYLRYIPAGRFWTLQCIEAAIFLVLTAALIAICLTVVVRSRPH